MKKYRSRTQQKERLIIGEIMEEQNVAFLDTEFLTSQYKGGPPPKLVSVGFVICRAGFQEICRFHSYIYMEDELHDKFKEVTGIAREELLQAPEYEDVMDSAMELLEKWEVGQIYVWGPDEVVLKRDLDWYREGINKKLRKSVNRNVRKIKDIEGIYSAKLGLKNIGISNMKILCGFEAEVKHNALSDAVDLKNIIQIIDQKGCPAYMVQIMKEYLTDKELYCRNRRLREQWSEIPDSVKEQGRLFMKELKAVETMEAKAMYDDIRVALTGVNPTFPSAEQYIQKYLSEENRGYKERM